MVVPSRASALVLLVVIAGLLVAVVGDRRVFPSAPLTVPATLTDKFQLLRQQMVKDAVIGWGIHSPEVIRAMREVPRHLFVPAEFLDQAYENHPLPIGYGQTISQPYIVALMTQELGVHPGDRVLEIGTGSGYQAAVLAECGAEVYSIEIIGDLTEEAQARLKQAGYDRIQLRHADGYWGWPEAAPFDGIIVTAAPDHVPQPLLDQLKVGGILVIPVGPPGGYQELWRIERVAEQDFRSSSLGGVRFVPLTGTE
ncbi:MAG: protein-L-isoaspartate(D-aspartate) O-methyltransferase [Chloroflexi bacterium]|nr:protein-L-isoaspartate(D-aspartate) O-methyltransferase [Chloroflexota bacterium]